MLKYFAEFRNLWNQDYPVVKLTWKEILQLLIYPIGASTPLYIIVWLSGLTSTPILSYVIMEIITILLFLSIQKYGFVKTFKNFMLALLTLIIVDVAIFSIG